MAWNDPGDKNPWGNGSKGNGSGEQGPPDLDELARKLQDKINGIFGGGRKDSGNGGDSSSGPSSGMIIALVLVATIVYALVTSVHIIQPAERGVVLRFGKYTQTLESGLRWTMPSPIDAVYRVDVEEIRSLPYTGTMLSADEAIVDLDLAVQYKIKDARDYLFQVQSPESTIDQATASAIREVVGKRTLDDVILGQRSAVAEEAHTLLQEILDSYQTGFEVTALNLDNAQAPSQVQSSFQDAIKAREDLERLKNEAEAYANDIIPKARGHAARLIQEATGYRDARVARAEGEVAQFSALLVQYKLAPEVTRERLFIETMEEVLGSTSKVMVDVKGDTSPLLYVPIDKLIGNATSVASATAPTTMGGQSSTSSGTSTAPTTSRTGRERNRGER